MINSIDELRDTLEDSLLQPNEFANIDTSERVLSLIGGAYIFCKGLTNLFSHPVVAVGETVVGTMLLQRGISGYCFLKAMTDNPKDTEETIFFTERQQSQPVDSEQ